ncbi:MAG TPA: DUF1152 domain-containing protein [Candidatus Binatus sp.]|nr:DUF1152 domain-containing protein [Candidatus Binatus sp.]
MTADAQSLEDLIRASSRSLVIGVGGGGDVVGALAAARFLEFCGLEFVLGGLSWERNVYDPIPGPRKLSETKNVTVLHEFAWLANSESQTSTGVPFAEAKMAAVLQQDALLVDINGGVKGVVESLTVAMKQLKTDLLVGLDVGGDSLADGHEPGLRSPLADSIMLAAFAELERRGHRTMWGVFGYGSDGELTVNEIEAALSKLAAANGLFGAWSLTPKIAAELEEVVKTVPTEASAIPLRCFRGAWGDSAIRRGERQVKLTPLTALTFFMSSSKLHDTLARPARALRTSASLDQANDALHAIGIATELDYERKSYQAASKK